MSSFRDDAEDAARVAGKYNPVINRVTFGTKEDAFEVKWNVIPHYKADSVKAKVRFTKRVEDSEFYLEIDTKPFRAAKEGLDEQQDDIFKVQAGFRYRF